MRLLNAHTLEFREFFDDQIPPYCILSHRWGENELSYKAYRKGINLSGPGYQKIIDFCFLIRHRKYPALEPRNGKPFANWVWVDTVCIDKRSSAELSEAINAMFRWYEDAVECIVYLADVTGLAPCGQDSEHCEDSNDISERICKSSWFCRGWTLQELLAPRQCTFFDSSWTVTGHVCHGCTPDSSCGGMLTDPIACGPSVSTIVAKITGIPQRYLHFSFRHASIAQRISWASNRVTTRVEDTAYCLLGLLDVNMPLLYGEGPMAFIRLQEEVIKRSSDSSILAWNIPSKSFCSILAESPQHVRNSGNVEKFTDRNEAVLKYTITNRGMEVQADTVEIIREEIMSMVRELVSDDGWIFFPAWSPEPNRHFYLLLLDCYNRTLVDGISTYQRSAIAVCQVRGIVYRACLSESLENSIQQAIMKGHVQLRKRQFSIDVYGGLSFVRRS